MTTGPIVHVIDDDESARESLTFLLATADFGVRTYNSGKAFLDTVPGMEAGCVITDVWMPEIGGLQIVRLLKKLKLDIPVIVITGHSDIPLAVEAMKAGAVDFIEKPYDGEALLAAVRSALSKQRVDAKRDGERAQIQERRAALSPRERQCWRGLSPATATRRLRTKWESARARSRSTGQTLWPRCRPRVSRTWCAWP
jgi:two-component system, LuxR family, response regulator FixJ